MNLEQSIENIQKEMDRIFKLTEQGDIVTADEAKQFHRICVALQSHAPDDWFDESEDFAHLADQFYKAIKNDNKEEAILIAESLRDAYSYLSSLF